MIFETLKEKIHQWGAERDLYIQGTIFGQVNKLKEETKEVEQAFLYEDKESFIKEIGDLYVVLINLCKMIDVTPEHCIYQAYEKIKDRKGKMVDGMYIKEDK